MTEEHQKHIEHYQMLLKDFSPELVQNNYVRNYQDQPCSDDIRITFDINHNHKDYHIKFNAYSETVIITHAEIGYSFSIALQKINKFVRGLYKRNLLFTGKKFYRIYTHAEHAINIDILKPELAKLCAFTSNCKIQNIGDSIKQNVPEMKKECLVVNFRGLPKTKEEMLVILEAIDNISQSKLTLF